MIPEHCFVIAEAGVNHNGSLDLAIELVRAAARCGADAVKFQTFRAEEIVTRAAPTAGYQRLATGAGEQFSMLKALELSHGDHIRLKEESVACGVEFMSTPFDRASADMLCSIGIRRIKVPSGELTNHPFLRYLAQKGLPLIVSTGMADLAEVTEALEVIGESRVDEPSVVRSAGAVTLLHCTSNYPAASEDANLMAMQSMRDAFSLPVGYSDHTEGTAVSVAAVALGARVIEKHFTLDRTMSGPDHKTSLLPSELARMIAEIRVVETALGDGVKRITDAERAIRDVARRSVTLAHAKQAGEALREDDLVMLRPGTGIAPKDAPRVVGRLLAQPLPAGTTLEWRHLSA